MTTLPSYPQQQQQPHLLYTISPNPINKDKIATNQNPIFLETILSQSTYQPHKAVPTRESNQPPITAKYFPVSKLRPTNSAVRLMPRPPSFSHAIAGHRSVLQSSPCSSLSASGIAEPEALETIA